MRVLIAESNPRLGDLYAGFLGEIGHEVHVVAAADTVGPECQSWRPDVVLLDMSLTLDGRTLLELPAVRDHGAAVIAVVADAAEPLGRKVLGLGAVDVVSRPLPLQRLAQIIAGLELYRGQGGGERRRLPRAAMPIPVRVRAETHWTAIDLSPFGVKVPVQAWIEPGTTVSLEFSLPDGGPPLRLKAVFSRAEADGHVLSFVDLPDADFRRLASYIKSCC